MKLLTKEILEKLPALGTTDNLPLDEHVLIVKFFDPYGSWKWYACEYDPKEQMFFGYVEGLENEWGYFSYKELTLLNFFGKPRIERDLCFKSIKYGEFIKAH
jgi:hypothetical protein